MTDEEKDLLEAFRSECKKCWEIAQRLDSNNPTIKGAFVGNPSDRIQRQLQHLGIFENTINS